MNNAWERAVEAGARVEAAYVDPMDHLDMSGIREKADRILRAAFPILAEDAIEAVEADYAFTLEGPDPSYELKDPMAYEESLRTAELLRHVFASLRARLEQMKETS